MKQEDARVSSGSEDDEARHTGPIPPGFSLVPSPMFGHGIMYMSHYLPPRGPTGCPTSMLADERRKRNRTFIDPVTEVPRLEYWFKRSTHPSHAVRIIVSVHVVIALICPSFGDGIKRATTAGKFQRRINSAHDLGASLATRFIKEARRRCTISQ